MLLPDPLLALDPETRVIESSLVGGGGGVGILAGSEAGGVISPASSVGVGTSVGVCSSVGSGDRGGVFVGTGISVGEERGLAGEETHIRSWSPSRCMTEGPGLSTGGPLRDALGCANGGLGSLGRPGGGAFLEARSCALLDCGGAGGAGSKAGGGPGGGGGGTPTADGASPFGIGCCCCGCPACSTQMDLPGAGGGGRDLFITWDARGSVFRVSLTMSWTTA